MRRQVYYELTPVGESLLGLIRTIERWSARGHAPPAAGRPTKHDTPAGTPARPRTIVARDAIAVSRDAIGSGFDPDLQLVFVTIAVHNIEVSAPAFAAAFGMSVPKFWDTEIPVPPDQRASIRLCWFVFPTFIVGLAQPVKGPAPHRAFLAKYGEGIHHLGFNTMQDVGQVIAQLVKKGGTWTLGGQGARYAQMDFRHLLGAAFGISPPWTNGPPNASGADLNIGGEALSRHRITNIGIVVRDLEEASRGYAEVLGLGVSQIKSVDLALPGVSIVSHGAARIAYLKQHGVAIKLIEPRGPGPLQDFVQRYGNRAHHIGFEVGHYFPLAVARLEALGGTVILGRRELGYALVDMTKTLGLVLELSGTAG